jgi:hypothetical protein
MEISRVGDRFLQTLKRNDGLMFRGVVYAPDTNNTRATGVTNSRKMLRVPFTSVIVAGDIIYSPTGVKFMCMNNGDSSYRDQAVFKSFMLTEVTHSLSWERVEKVLDPVTQRPVRDSIINLGFVEGTLEPTTDMVDAVRVSAPEYRLLTSAAVQLNDKLAGKWVVRRCETLLGIQVVDLR